MIGLTLVALTLLATFVVVALRLRAVLFRQNLDGRAFLAGIEALLARGDRSASITACEAARGTAVAEVILAALEAAPNGSEPIDREAVERAVDEAQLDWLPEAETARGTLGSLARVCGAAGMLGAAIEIRAMFAQAASARGLTTVILAIGGGILGIVVSLYAKSLVSTTTSRITAETTTAARRIVSALGSAPAPDSPTNSP
ncbi:MAG: hypothetical protein HYY06_19360 [Deltaproteobacteria bacterium]|nr:hypothetical protein [Deltaproteobacteria bacterium]